MSKNGNEEKEVSVVEKSSEENNLTDKDVLEGLEGFYSEELSAVTIINPEEELIPESEKNKVYFINEYSDFSKQKRVRGYITKKTDPSTQEEKLSFKRVSSSDKSLEKNYPIVKVSLFSFLKYRFGFFSIFVFFFFSLLFLYAYPLYAISTQLALFFAVSIFKPFKNLKNLKRSLLFMKIAIVSGLLFSTAFMFLGNNSGIAIVNVSQGLFLSSVSYFMTFYVYSFYYRFYNIYKRKETTDDMELSEDSFFIWRGVHQ